MRSLHLHQSRVSSTTVLDRSSTAIHTSTVPGATPKHAVRSLGDVAAHCARRRPVCSSMPRALGWARARRQVRQRCCEQPAARCSASRPRRPSPSRGRPSDARGTRPRRPGGILRHSSRVARSECFGRVLLPVWRCLSAASAAQRFLAVNQQLSEIQGAPAVSEEKECVWAAIQLSYNLAKQIF